MATPAIPAFRFGKNAVVKVAAATPADGTKPAAADAFKVLCLTNEVTIGLSNGTITLENFCTGGADVEVPDGTTTGKVELGDATWTEADPALILLEAAAFNSTGAQYSGYVWFEVMPLGAGTTKPVYDILVFVKEWSMKTPSKGVITVQHALLAQGAPNKGVQA